MLKNYLFIMLSVLIATYSFGQEYINIADGGTHTLDCLTDSIIVTDSGGENGTYGSYEFHEITFCLDEGEEGNLEVSISPSLFGDTWDVDANSYLAVYDGANINSPQIGGGTFNSTNAPNGILVRSTNPCITLVFMSQNFSSSQGFTAHVQCETSFQPFLVDLTSDPEFEVTTLDSLSLSICLSDTFTVTANTSYFLSDSSGYESSESDSTTYFYWNMGDGYSKSGYGLNEITYAYATGNGYKVNLQVSDLSGTTKTYGFSVLQAPPPNFSNLALNDTVCIGSETVISGGIFEQDIVGIQAGSGSILSGTTFTGPTPIFDANPPDCDIYSIPLIINEFQEGQTINDISDISNICVNMYHSWLGDLEMGLVCPGGQDTLVLFDMRSTSGPCPNLFSGGSQSGGRKLGDPNAMPIPIAYDYCFNNDPQYGTFATVNTDLPNTIPMPTGSYEPMSPMEDLLGCSLNGEWELIILDGWTGSVGVINTWSIYFNPEITPSTEYYSPAIVSAGWDENPDLVVNEDSTSVTVAPSHVGDNGFVFWVHDEFGCRHDTVINIYARSNDDSECITGIGDIALHQKFLIAPNPAENYADVMFEIRKPQTVEILITTLEGKLVSKKKYHFAFGEQNQRINLEQVVAGAYLVTLLGETFKSSELLIKN